jgi:hypothetical protein
MGKYGAKIVISTKVLPLLCNVVLVLVMKKTYIILAAALMAALSAYARKKSAGDEAEVFSVQKVENSAAAASGDFAYALPRTLLRIKVTIERTLFTRGIYAEYAEKYLGLQDVRRKDAEQYAIIAVEVAPMQEADPSEIYIAHGANPNSSLFRLHTAGLTLGLPMPLSGIPAAYAMPQSDWAMPAFTNMGYEITIKNMPAKTAATDSLLPVLPTASAAPRGKEAQAAEAAKMLMQLRRRRIELISGEIESVFANGDAMKTAIAELKTTERQYLELFTGIVQRSKADYYYDINPEKGKEQYPLFYFSPESGMDNDQQPNSALYLQCTEPFPAFQPNSAAYIYRIPCISAMRIVADDSEIFRGRCAIFQYGRMVNMFP